jgi:hypothetical protein
MFALITRLGGYSALGSKIAAFARPGLGPDFFRVRFLSLYLNLLAKEALLVQVLP